MDLHLIIVASYISMTNEILCGSSQTNGLAEAANKALLDPVMKRVRIARVPGLSRYYDPT